MFYLLVHVCFCGVRVSFLQYVWGRGTPFPAFFFLYSLPYLFLFLLFPIFLFSFALPIFLFCLSLPFLPESSHSVYRPEIVGGDCLVCCVNFVDDVMFSQNGANGPELKTICVFCLIRR